MYLYVTNTQFFIYSPFVFVKEGTYANYCPLHTITSLSLKKRHSILWVIC